MPFSPWARTAIPKWRGTRRSPRSRGRPSGRPLPPIVAELQCDAEVLFSQQTHHFLQIVSGPRADAQLIALNRRLDLLQLRILDELDDVPRLFGGDSLLQRDLLTHRAVGGRLRRASRQILHWHIAANQTDGDDFPQCVQLEFFVRYYLQL